MRTAGPTTGPAHSAFKLRKGFLDTDISRFRFFAGYNPANPLIARERSNVFP